MFVVNGKGRGTCANPRAAQESMFEKTPNEYVLGQLNGTITELPAHVDQDKWSEYSRTVSRVNNWSHSKGNPTYPPFKHVMYMREPGASTADS